MLKFRLKETDKSTVELSHEILHSRASQHQHYWHFEPENSLLFCGAVLCIVGWLAAASPCFPVLTTIKMSPKIASQMNLRPGGGKLTTVESHCYPAMRMDKFQPCTLWMTLRNITWNKISHTQGSI